MSTAAVLLEQADANQARASNPAVSAWVSANAGTGKTAVLVKRGLRLLLVGTAPESILCLTYTKTAAAEMQNRLLGRLSGWATANPETLHEDLAKLLERDPTEAEVRTARRLFAHVLEAKGGLKIHTIHGFCERLLQRFPLEAGVAPHFAVLDELKQEVLRHEAFEAAISRATLEADGPIGSALATLLDFTSGDHIRKVIDAVLGKRGELSRIMAYHDSQPDWTALEGAALKELFAVAEHTEDGLLHDLHNVLSDQAIGDAIATYEAIAPVSPSDRETADRLRGALGKVGEARLLALALLFLTNQGTPRARLGTNGFKRDAPDLIDKLEKARDRFAELHVTLKHFRLAEASAAVLVIADAVQTAYEQLKERQAALDYDDLIIRAQSLLMQTGAAAWVHYKIDGGVDHILVDEAQDTNPAQWSIVESLAEEFFAGEGRSTKLRTLFAVGDEKQSIYSFQGANPARFGEIGRRFKRKADDVTLDWEDVPLTLSFRSTEPILTAVDAVFANPHAAKGVIWQGSAIAHQAYRTGQAGLVELWDIQKDETAEEVDPFSPWQEKTAGARAVENVCKRIADTIAGWLDNGELLAARGRPIKAGDILILVRRRDPFTTPMIRALKHKKIPVAGADRMKLMDQIAVQDLVALADFLLMPDDDLTLAVLLKSPLVGLTDDDLLKFAPTRKGSLWDAFKQQAAHDPRYEAAAEHLKQWLARADYQPPYEFYSEVLDADGQHLRKAMLTRLGPEAAEAIDEFLDRAIAFDREEAPSLQGFVNQLRESEVEVKRDMDQERDEVRIMTVHGAKGLEAPIVFLPDTCMGPRAQNPRLFSLPRPDVPPDEVGHMVWPPRKHSDVERLKAAKDAADYADRDEYHRLLYVAMTRAEDRLYVCGWEGIRRRDDNCWYNLISAGLMPHLPPGAGDESHVVHRRASDQTASIAAPTAAAERAAEEAALPDWAVTSAPQERARARLAPSRLTLGAEQGVEALGPEQTPLGPLALSENYRFVRGRLVHALLQHLPAVAPELQEGAARRFIDKRGAELTQAFRDEIVAETLAVVRHAEFAPLFRPGSVAEVPIVARIGDADLQGQIDRLVETEAGLMIVDYKTNRPPPTTLEDVAEAYILQLAAYRMALRRLYPGRPLRAALLWTDGARLMEIPADRLDAGEQTLLEHQGEP